VSGVSIKSATNIDNYGQTVWGFLFAQIMFDPPSNGLSVHGTGTPKTWQRRIASLKLINWRQACQNELKVTY
jgi:hypothetical protein